MRGVMFNGNRECEIREFPDPHAGPGQAVVKIRASGMCGTDLHRYRGDVAIDAITGHEPCGVIHELGAGAPAGLKVGDRVVVHHYEGCGICEICSKGFEQACPHGHVTFGGVDAHGANADYILVPSRLLIHLPEELSFEGGAAISCGTGTAWNGLKKINVAGGDVVSIFGQGPVGLSGTMCAKYMGAKVIAVDVVPERLELARRYGADHVINAKDTDPVEAIRELTGGLGSTAALETSGNPECRSQILKAMRTFGRCCYVGMGPPSTINFRDDVIFKVATIIGSWTFNKSELIEICRFMVEEKVPLDDLVTHRFALDDAVEAFRVFDSATTGKCVFVLD